MRKDSACRSSQIEKLKNYRYRKRVFLKPHGWVSIQNPDREDWDELTHLIQEAYLRASPKRMVKKWNELNKK